MRRLSAILVLAWFLGTPLSQWRCEIACAMDDVSEPADACHHHHTAAVEGVPVLTSQHDCGWHPTPAAILATSRALNSNALPAAYPTPVVAVAIDPTIVSSVAPSPPGGPPGGLVVPLRI